MSTMTMTRSRSRSWSIRRPSLLLTVTILHPRLPLGRIWLPVLSLPLYALLVLVGMGLCCMPRRRLEKLTQGVSMSPVRLGLTVIQFAGALLCNGSYTLCDINVAEENVRVRVRTI